jgi:para-nitrobenzyl esterase
MDTVVTTRSGDVLGSKVANVYTFKGIPYAAPPFGTRRFQPPQTVEPWSGVRNALAYGPTVPKPPYFPPFDTLLAEPVIPGEDCLNLNIWSRDLGQANLPVLVWLHGGAFANGSGSITTYDGSNFARDGVVCVTINYRLGIDGFLFLEDGNTNRGLLDQIAALKWVQENIAAFGGNPGNITIAGESAGAMSVGTILSMSSTKNLFQRAIAQSGAGHHVISAGTAQRVGQYFAEKLGIELTAEALAKVPLATLVQAQVELSADVFNRPDPAFWGEVATNRMPFEPVIDGAILSERPIDSITAGNGAGVDLLVGTNTEEERLFMVPNQVIGQITSEVLNGLVAAYGFPAAETLAIYGEDHPNASPGDLLADFNTDWFFRIPAIRLAEAQVKNDSRAYMYEFGWRSPQFAGTLGACHAAEIAFVFDNLVQDENVALLGKDAPQQTADKMHAAWVAFIASGDPGWPKYDFSRRATMRFDTTSDLVNDPHAARRMLWEGRR